MAEKELRLDKYLADMKVGTRSEVKLYIRKGRVAVNQQIVRDVGFKVLSKDLVTFDGMKINYTKTEYLMLYKPAGVLTATKDKHQRTVFSLLEETKRKDLFPVGRLDKDTEGLLLLTNNGTLAHRLLSPKYHVDKTYYAKIAGKVGEEEIRRFAEGIFCGEFTALPAKLEIKKTGEISEVEVTVQEGKFHQVKRMFEAVGAKVIYLKRLRMGSLYLDENLTPGQSRELTAQEIEELLALAGISSSQKQFLHDQEDKENMEQRKSYLEISPNKSKKEIAIDLKTVMNRVKGVLFDLDGTLVDSMWMWKEIDIEYLGRFGISLPEGLQEQIEGMSFSETANYFQSHFPQITENIEEMKASWNRMAGEKYATKVFLKPGALGFLKYLKTHGIRTGIATSNSYELVHTVLSALGVEQYFDEVHTACEVGAGKPAPDIYLYVAKTLDILPEDCLVFEDICKGIMAGKAAGMRVCAVQDLYSKEAEEKKRAMADYFINDYRDFGFPA